MMATPWAQVAASPQYQAMPPQQQEAARNQYFAQVVAPQIKDPGQQAQAKAQFDQQTLSRQQSPIDENGEPMYKPPAPPSGGQLFDGNPLTQARDLAVAGLHNLGNQALGIGAGGAHLFGSAVNAVAPNSGFAHTINRLNAQGDQDVKAREDHYQATTPNTLGAYTGAAIGQLAPWMMGMGELRAAGLLPTIAAPAANAGLLARAGNLAARVGVQTGEGMLYGAGQTVTGQGDYGSQKLAQIAGNGMAGGALPLVGAGAGAANSARRFLFAPDSAADKAIARVFGNDASTVQRLQHAGQDVPGLVPTAAEAVPSPANTQMERNMRNKNGVPFKNQDVANDQARMNVVQKLAGTPEEMQAAVAAKKAIAEPMYAKLANVPVDPSPVVKALQALQASPFGVNSRIHNAAQDAIDAIQKRSGSDGKIAGDQLAAVREEVDGFLAKHATPLAPIKSKETAALVPIKNQITDALDAALPGHRADMAALAKSYEPINTMASVGKLLDKVRNSGSNAGGGQAASLNALRALLDANGKARYPMSADARQQLEGVFKSLQARSTINNVVGASGPGTAAEATPLISAQQKTMLKSAVGGLAGLVLGGHVGGPGAAELGGMLGLGADAGISALNNRVGNRVAERLANARMAAEAIQRFNAQQAGTLGSLVNRYLPNVAPRQLPRP
jgi:hypothetical protein